MDSENLFLLHHLSYSSTPTFLSPHLVSIMLIIFGYIIVPYCNYLNFVYCRSLYGSVICIFFLFCFSFGVNHFLSLPPLSPLFCSLSFPHPHSFVCSLFCVWVTNSSLNSPPEASISSLYFQMH